MNLRTFSFTAPAAILCAAAIASTGFAQEPAAPAGTAIDRIELFDSLESPSDRTRPEDLAKGSPSIGELRQQMAWYRAKQRAMRTEQRAWMGRNPSRPQWNAIPMTSSFYQNRVVYVPAYYYYGR